MRFAAIVAVLALVGCGDRIAGTEGVGRVHVTLTGPKDTVAYEVPVTARRCGNGRGILLDGARHGNGLLVWLRSGGAIDTGAYPLLSRADSGAVRGAISAVRYVAGIASHGLIVDEGTAVLQRATPPYALRVNGRAIETSVAGQRKVSLTVDGVQLRADTTNCQVHL
jgi:hypothetical protein